MVVGPEKKKFVVHKNIITARSPFFEKACSEMWSRSGPHDGVELPETDPAIFDVYLHCIYTNDVDVGHENFQLHDEEDMAWGDRMDLRMAKTYILADYLRDVCAANSIMKSLISRNEEASNIASSFTMSLIFKNATHDSPIRMLMLDYLVHQAAKTTIEIVCNDETIPRSVLGEVLVRKVSLEEEHVDSILREAINPDFVSDQKQCHYYQHDEANPTCGQDCLKKEKANAGGLQLGESKN